MIQEYLYETIALIIILTSIVIYFLTVKFQQEEQDISENLEKKNKKPVQSIQPKEEITLEEETEIPEEEPYILTGDEEGSFGNISNNPFDEQERQTTQKKHRTKIEVPAHGKITKEHFKEFAGVKILVAEDNFINQKVISGLLADTGIEVTMADDGQIALDILEENSDFNFILMDAHMPRVNGFQATRAIRDNPKYEHILVVALSGDTAADDILKMKNSGMEEYLEKPLRMDDFYDILYAYTKEESQTNEFVEVIMTKELNGDQGLSVCGGDDEFYKDILKEFINNYTHSTKKLSELLQNNDLQTADSMLLDFIGITANIGAETIRDIALELKEAIKDTEERSYNILLEEYQQHLEVLIRDIRDYVK